MLYVTNALSLNMLPSEAAQGTFRTCRISLEQARQEIGEFRSEFQSAVGHADTARLFSTLLGIEVPCARTSVVLDERWKSLLVGQYTGPRLPEGATTLPEGAKVEWFTVEWLDVRWERRSYWYGDHDDASCPHREAAAGKQW